MGDVFLTTETILVPPLFVPLIPNAYQLLSSASLLHVLSTRVFLLIQNLTAEDQDALGVKSANTLLNSASLLHVRSTLALQVIHPRVESVPFYLQVRLVFVSRRVTTVNRIKSAAATVVDTSVWMLVVIQEHTHVPLLCVLLVPIA